MAEYLLGMHRALGLISSTTHNNNRTFPKAAHRPRMKPKPWNMLFMSHQDLPRLSKLSSPTLSLLQTQTAIPYTS